MAIWNDVEDNVNRQIHSLSSAPHSGDIRDCYPELHLSKINGVFSNTVGSNVLADLMTSPCVVVDLYAWSSESDLIRTYGVDFDFLLTLRDHGHVVLAANHTPERYKDCQWLHEVLADHRTLFRSVRTPMFFAETLRADPHFTKGLYASISSSPDPFNMLSQAIEEEFRSSFVNLSPEERQYLFVNVGAAEPPQTEDDLRRILSIWTARLIAFEPQTGLDLAANLTKEPRLFLPQLRQWQMFGVGMVSSGLGGTVRRPVDAVRDLYPEDHLKEIGRQELLFINELGLIPLRLVNLGVV